MEHIFYNYYVSDKLDPIVNKMKQEYYKYLDPNDSIKKDNKKIGKSVLCLLQNFIRLLNRDTKVATINLNKNGFSHGPIFNGIEIKQKKLSYQYTRGFIDFLVAKDYIELSIGYKGEGNYGVIYSENSSVKLLDKLVDLLNNYICFDEWNQNVMKSVLVLKDAEGNVVPFKLTPKLKRMTDMMITYNKTFENRVSLDGNTLEVFFFKVFNGSFNQGGRSYESTVQQFSQEIRSKMIIDGQKVVELDFSAHHPRILYSQDCVNLDYEYGPDFDPYAISFPRFSKETNRKLAKELLMIVLNTEGFEYARGAFNKKIFEDRKRMENGEPSKYGFKGLEDIEDAVPCRDLVHALLDHNEPLSFHFFKSNSLKLQNIDSKISDAIIDTFNQKDEVVVCVHDSYVVAEKNEEFLKQTMLKAYKDVVGNNFNCKITKK